MGYYRRKPRFNPLVAARTLYAQGNGHYYVISATRLHVAVHRLTVVKGDANKSWWFSFHEHAELEGIFDGQGWDLERLAELIQELD